MRDLNVATLYPFAMPCQMLPAERGKVFKSVYTSAIRAISGDLRLQDDDREQEQAADDGLPIGG
jgi:hypothetical protein